MRASLEGSSVSERRRYGHGAQATIANQAMVAMTQPAVVRPDDDELHSLHRFYRPLTSRDRCLRDSCGR
jgi:hypothetical protein